MEFDPKKAFKSWLAMGGKLREEELRPKWHLLKCLMPNGDFYAASVCSDGSVSHLGDYVDYGGSAIRPAMWITHKA